MPRSSSCSEESIQKRIWLAPPVLLKSKLDPFTAFRQTLKVLKVGIRVLEVIDLFLLDLGPDLHVWGNEDDRAVSVFFLLE